MIANYKWQVEQILKNIPETRNNDRLLYIEYLKRFCTRGRTKIDINELLEYPDLSHIVRIRRYWQELRYYIPTTLKVCIKRGISEKRWKKEMAI